MDSVERLDSVLKNIFLTMPQILNEKQKRILSGSIAQGYGYGGIKAVSSVSGMDAKTIRSGIREIENGLVNTADSARIRREGAGRPGIEKKYPEIAQHIQEIIECNTYGDPEKVILWTNLGFTQK